MLLSLPELVFAEDIKEPKYYNVRSKWVELPIDSVGTSSKTKFLW